MSKTKIITCSRCKKSGHNVRSCKKKKQENTKKPEKYFLYVVYDETQTGGEICEGCEDSDWPDYETTYREYRFKYCLRNFDYEVHSKNLGCAGRTQCEVLKEVFDCNEVYIPIVYYSDGDTFSSSSGNVSIVGIYDTYEKAKLSLEYDIQDSKSKKPQKYYDWMGYFNSLESTEIIKLSVFDANDLTLKVENNCDFNYRDLTLS